MPLLAFSLSALGQDKLGAAAARAGPLVLVKEDLGVSAVAVIGALIAWRGARRLGIGTVVVGLVATALEVTVFPPLFNSAGSYGYWNRLGAGPSLFHVAVTSLDLKAATLLATLAITGFVALFSPLVLVAVPTLVWRFVSNDANYWGTSYHYSAVLIPVVVAAMIDTLAWWRGRRSRGRRWASRIALAVGRVVALTMIPSHAFSKFFRPELWQPNSQSAAINTALSKIPNGATVSASDNVVPQLTSRATVTLFGLAPLATIRPEWILVDPESTRHFRVTREQEHRDLIAAETDGYSVVMSQDDITLLRDSRK